MLSHGQLGHGHNSGSVRPGARDSTRRGAQGHHLMHLHSPPSQECESFTSANPGKPIIAETGSAQPTRAVCLRTAAALGMVVSAGCDRALSLGSAIQVVCGELCFVSSSPQMLTGQPGAAFGESSSGGIARAASLRQGCHASYPPVQTTTKNLGKSFLQKG